MNSLPTFTSLHMYVSKKINISKHKNEKKCIYQGDLHTHTHTHV